MVLEKENPVVASVEMVKVKEEHCVVEYVDPVNKNNDVIDLITDSSSDEDDSLA